MRNNTICKLIGHKISEQTDSGYRICRRCGYHEYYIVCLENCRENFRDENGNAFVVRCPKCKRENWAMAVASGQCSWCGWTDANGKDHA